MQVGSPEDAGVSWIELQRDPERNKKMGEAARRLVEESRGATDRAVEAIRAYIASGQKYNVNEITVANSAAALAVFGCVWRGGAVTRVVVREWHLQQKAFECAGGQRGKFDGWGHGKNADGALAGGEVSWRSTSGWPFSVGGIAALAGPATKCR